MKKFRLDPECREVDGLRVLVLSDDSFPVVSVYSIVGVGSAGESDSEAGISHFVEHLLFKGTAKRPVGRISQEVMKAGGEINGFTTYDYTGYTITIDSSRLGLALDIHGDAMANSTFDPSEMKKERGVILEEVKLGETSPSMVLREEVMRRMFPGHSYGRPIIGFRKTVKGASRDSMMDYLGRHYTRENVTVIVVGDTTADAAAALVEKSFSDVPVGKKIIVGGEVGFGEGESFERRKGVNNVYVRLAMPGVGLSHPDYPALAILGMILGSGKCGRLSMKIRYPGIASSIGCGTMALKDSGVLSLSATCQPDRTEELVDAVRAELERAAPGPFEKAELERAQKMILAGSVYDMDTFAERASYQAHYAALATHDFDGVYLDAVENMTLDSIEDAAGRYLKPENAVLGKVVPRKKLKSVGPAGKQQFFDWRISRLELPAAEGRVWEQEGKVRKTALSNGITFVYREDRQLPLVSCRALFRAGTSHEHGLPGRGGVALMTQQLLLKGAAGRSFLATSGLIESLGIDMAGSTRPDEAGVYFDSLEEEVDTALVLLRDAVINPEFDKAEFERQRAEMIARVRHEKDDMMSYVAREGSKALWQDHPYARSPYGEEEDLAGMSVDDVRVFHKKFYRPDRLVLSMVGDISAEAALAKAEGAFGSMTAADSIEEELPLYSPVREPIDILDKKQWPAAIVTMGWRCPSLLDDDFIPLRVFSSVLGNPLGSRIWNAVREKRGLAYATGSFYYPGVLGGAFCLYAGVNPSKISMVKDLLLKQVEEMKMSPVTKEELADSKSFITGSHRLHHQGAAQLADYLALYEISGLGYQFDDEYCGRIEAVTADDLMRVAQKHLDADNFVTLTVRPRSQILSILKSLLKG